MMRMSDYIFFPRMKLRIISEKAEQTAFDGECGALQLTGY